MKRKHVAVIGLVLIALVALSGCQPNNQDANPGFFHYYFVSPFTGLIQMLADLFNGNYGVAIILITFIIRLLLLPLMLKQYKNQQHMKEKMEAMKPEMDKIQKKLKETKDPEKQRKLQQEMMMLYQKHNFNPLTSMGCLPIIIQMPILMGFYYAIRSSKEIASHSFLWYSLGQPDIIMALIAGLIYYVQFKVSQVSLPEQTRKQMRFLGLLSPAMILFISFSAPAALPLYWSVSGLLLIGQTWLGKKLYPPLTTDDGKKA